jgi:hypothetical protein
MKLSLRLKTAAVAVTLLGTALGLAAEKSGAGKSADDYPLKTCVVSDETLGSMGEFVTYVHKEAGKPDRTIRLCCEGCIDDFRKEPAKFLAKLDAAKEKSGEKKARKAR